MMRTRLPRSVVCAALALGAAVPTMAQDGLSAGYASADITPETAVPMWGYGHRRDTPSFGTLTPLRARAVVLAAGARRLAIVATDLGRGPTPAMMSQVRAALQPRGIDTVLIAGTHTHHGPVIELNSAEGCGRPRLDDAVDYAERLPALLIAVIGAADDARAPAAIGTAHTALGLNRNRHAKGADAPRDDRLIAVRIDRTTDGAPIAVLVNWAAHPVMTAERDARFSADYPGFLCAAVEAAHGGGCLFLQGAAGDLSPDPTGEFRDPRAYGEELAEHTLALLQGIEPRPPQRPRLRAVTDHFSLPSRVDFTNAAVRAAFRAAFFPELVASYLRTFTDGIPAEVTTANVGDALAVVAISGEVFCQHAVTLRQRAARPDLLVLGYCNGHSMYLPTIEAAVQGGYGADPMMAPACVGSGERLLNRAYVRLLEHDGKLRNGVGRR